MPKPRSEFWFRKRLHSNSTIKGWVVSTDAIKMLRNIESQCVEKSGGGRCLRGCLTWLFKTAGCYIEHTNVSVISSVENGPAKIRIFRPTLPCVSGFNNRMPLKKTIGVRDFWVFLTSGKPDVVYGWPLIFFMGNEHFWWKFGGSKIFLYYISISRNTSRRQF